MNVQTLCLAILHESEATGYEIRKMSTEGEFGYFVEASFGSIYPALAKLEKAGFVSFRVETQAGRPSKKIYRITEAGQVEFQHTMSSPLNEDIHRSEFLLFARFAHLMSPELVDKRVDERLAEIDATMMHIKSQIKDGSHMGDEWVLRHAITCLSSMHNDIAAHKHELISIAAAGEKTTVPAE